MGTPTSGQASTSTAHIPPPPPPSSRHGPVSATNSMHQQRHARSSQNNDDDDDDEEEEDNGHDSARYRDARSDMNDTGYSTSSDSEFDDDEDNDEWHNAPDLADLIQQAEKCKQEGNTHFTAGRIQPAIEAYKQGIATLPARKSPTPPRGNGSGLVKGKGREDLAEKLLDDDDDDGDEDEDRHEGPSARSKDKIRELRSDKDEKEFVEQDEISEEENQVRELRGALWCNLATSFFKQAMYKEAVEAATQATKDKPEYVKALLRRAAANEKLDTWTSLSSALEDYKYLSILPNTPKASLPDIQRALRRLPPILEQRKDEETKKMMEQLKGLGNSLLGRFGLSTDNFQFTKNESGGYGMNFVQQPTKQ